MRWIATALAAGALGTVVMARPAAAQDLLHYEAPAYTHGRALGLLVIAEPCFPIERQRQALAALTASVRQIVAAMTEPQRSMALGMASGIRAERDFLRATPDLCDRLLSDLMRYVIDHSLRR